MTSCKVGLPWGSARRSIHNNTVSFSWFCGFFSLVLHFSARGAAHCTTFTISRHLPTAWIRLHLLPFILNISNSWRCLRRKHLWNTKKLIFPAFLFQVKCLQLWLDWCMSTAAQTSFSHDTRLLLGGCWDVSKPAERQSISQLCPRVFFLSLAMSETPHTLTLWFYLRWEACQPCLRKWRRTTRVMQHPLMRARFWCHFSLLCTSQFL